MKHAVVLSLALFSMLFLMGDSCDSGDFTTSYFFCCTDTLGLNCTTDSTQCASSVCSTGQQTFSNGQNECTILQTDAANNNCALYARFIQYINIGCTGIFTDNYTPALTFLAPTNLTAAAGPVGSGVINLSWSPPANYPTADLVYTVSDSNVTLSEGFLVGNISGTTFQVPGLTPGATYFFTVQASLVYAGNVAQVGTISNEASAVAQ